jgi:hypothetical protein
MTHDPVNDLHALSDELLETARASSSGRAARTVFGQAHQTLHQTLIALLAGQGLAEHGNPGQATLHGSLGALLAVPERDHSLTAVQDTVLLLTVAKLEH